MNYVKHIKWSALFEKRNKSRNWQDQEFLLIAKNGKIGLFDMFSNRSLCSIESFKELTSWIQIVFTDGVSRLVINQDEILSQMNIHSKVNIRPSAKNDEFSIRDTLKWSIDTMSKLLEIEWWLKLVSSEVKWELWIIDLLCFNDNTSEFYIFEVKKNWPGYNIQGQLERYETMLTQLWHKSRCYAVAEDFSETEINNIKNAWFSGITFKDWKFTVKIGN